MQYNQQGRNSWARRGLFGRLKRFCAVAWLVGTLGAVQATAGPGSELELVSVSRPTDQIDQRFPWNECSLAAGAEISLISPKDPENLVQQKLPNLIDVDPCSGLLLQGSREYQFLVTWQRISRIRSVTVTGKLQGATISVKLTDEPREPGEGGWNVATENQPLRSPATSIVFRGQSAIRAIVTIKAPNASIPPPFLTQIGLYSNDDVREFELQPNPNYTVSRDPRECPYDFLGAYAGARVLFASASSSATAFRINDGNPETACEFPPKERESVLVIDLGRERRVGRLNFLYSQKEGGELTCYLAKKLPGVIEVPVATLSWLGNGSNLLSLMPFGLPQVPSQGNSFSRSIRVTSSWFDGLTSLGTQKTDDNIFSQFAPPKGGDEGRYLVQRFIDNSPPSSGAFRIYSSTVTGNYPFNYFVLAPRELPEREESALITSGTSPPPAPEASPDFGKLRDAVVVPLNPPASPSSP